MLIDMDINAIAGTLKLYFRELPEPLLTDRLYPAFMEGIGTTFDPQEHKSDAGSVGSVLTPVLSSCVSDMVGCIRVIIFL